MLPAYSSSDCRRFRTRRMATTMRMSPTAGKPAATRSRGVCSGKYRGLSASARLARIRRLSARRTILMSDYQAPVKDMLFVMRTNWRVSTKSTSLPGFRGGDVRISSRRSSRRPRSWPAQVIAPVNTGWATEHGTRVENGRPGTSLRRESSRRHIGNTRRGRVGRHFLFRRSIGGQGLPYQRRPRPSRR